MALDQEWRLLREVAGGHNLALEIPWLRRMYLRAFQHLLGMLKELEANYSAAEYTSQLGDPTFWELAEKHMLANRGATPEAKVRDLLEMLRTNMIDGRDPLPDLKDDGLVIATYGVMTGSFAHLTIDTVAEVLGTLADPVAPAAINRLGAIIDLAIEEKETDCLILAQLCVVAARHAASTETLAHALSTLGTVLCDEKIGYKEQAVEVFKEAHGLFIEAGDTERAQITALNVKRLRAETAPTPSDGLDLTPEERDAVKRYNAACQAGNLEAAIRILDAIEPEASPDARLEFNGMIGNLFLGTDQISKAYKRLNRCRNIRERHNLFAHRSATPELLEANLLFHEHRSREAAELLLRTLDRLDTQVSLDKLMTLYVSLTAALSDFDDDETIARATTALLFAESDDRVFLLSNRAVAHLSKGDLDAADKDVTDAFMYLGKPETNPSLAFDLYFRRASIIAKSKDVAGRLEELQAEIDSALKFSCTASGAKLRNLFQIYANAMPEESSARARELLEQGLDRATAHFHSIARVKDDIHDRERLLSGYLVKSRTFTPFLRLFGMYWDTGDDKTALARAQAVKSIFLNEAFVSTSENLVAKRLAQSMAGLLNSDGANDELSMLKHFSDLSAHDPKVWRTTVEKLLRDKGILDEQPMIRPVSLENAEMGSFGLALQAQTERDDELAPLSDPDFLARFLAPDTGLVEFVVTGAKAMALLLLPDGKVVRVGTYTKPALEADMGMDERIAALCAALAGFAENLMTCLPANCQAVTLCPMDWVWGVPFAALPLDHGFLCDRLDLVLSPSASYYALCRARYRVHNAQGAALIDPLDELKFADAFAHLCQAPSPVAFDPVVRWEMSPGDLRDAAESKGWFMVAAHGSRDDTSLGLGAGLRIQSDKEARSLSSGSVIFEPLPGLACRTALILSCHAAEQPDGAAEPLGIATALTIGGARNVVAPLWEIDEVATIVFFAALLEALEGDAANGVALAVRHAQQQLREMTVAEFRAAAPRLFPKRCSATLETWQGIKLGGLNDTDKPFADPYHWGAFCVLGAD